METASGGLHATAGGCFLKELRSVGRSHGGAGKKCDERGVVCTPCLPWGGRGVGNEAPKLSLGRRWRREKCSGFCLGFSPPKSILIGNTLVFPKTSLFGP